MNKLNNEDLLEIVGGANILTATFLNAVARCIESILEVGRAIGSSLARLSKGNICH
ncbi:MAG: hypothetical protein HFI09_04345 [Bacilli bacterium]|nr:hypothetical protein [Bacilli bacterium]